MLMNDKGNDTTNMNILTDETDTFSFLKDIQKQNADL